MKNKVGRDIPDSMFKTVLKGAEVFQGVNYRDGYVYKKASPTVSGYCAYRESKVAGSLKEAIEKTGLKDGMTISFHHHFRDGDYIVNMVMDAVAQMGIKDITICPSSLTDCHDHIVPYIEDGTITGMLTSGLRGKIGEAVSAGKLKKTAWIRSHDGRVRAIECGDIHIDVAFIGAPTSDVQGNANGLGGKSNCGPLSYAEADAKYADKVVIITDCLVAYPNKPSSIKGIDVDYVVVVDEIGNPEKIASNMLRMTKDPRELKIAKYAAQVIANTEYFKDGFSYQTGGGGMSLAVSQVLSQYMISKNSRMGFAIGGVQKPLVDMLHDGLVGRIVDCQCFDAAAIQSLETDDNHSEITISEYANPLNKGCFVNQLDYVVLSALEIDMDFNVNVTTGSDGVLRGALGGHVDTAAGAKCTIIVAPLVRSRIPTVRERVTTVSTPGETVDVFVSEYGIAVNPRRGDLMETLKESGLPIYTIEQLKEEAYQLVGKPEEIEYRDEIVAIVEYRDGTIMDVVRRPAPYVLDEMVQI